MDVMLDIEGLGTGPDTTILTIAAQGFDPLGSGYYHAHSFYVRVNLESQADRSIQDGTIEWWATQPAMVKNEAFGEHDRVSLSDALDGLTRIVWKANRVWAQGPTYDMTILEHAYKSLNKALPWKYFSVRDSRTVFGLWPGLEAPPATHNALEDCRRQISMLQETLKYLNIKELK